MSSCVVVFSFFFSKLGKGMGTGVSLHSRCFSSKRRVCIFIMGARARVALYMCM